MKFYRSSKPRVFSIVALSVILAILISMVSVSTTMKAYAETIDYYELKVGGDTVAVFQEEEDAYSIIDEVKGNYIDQDSNVVDVKLTPAITVEKVTVSKDEEQPEVADNAGSVVDYLIAADVDSDTYVVKEGDTLWDISMALNMSIDAIARANPQLDIENIHAGDEINIKAEAECPVHVIVEYEEVNEEVVPFETEYQENPDMYYDEEEVLLVEGQDGISKVTAKVITINGVVDSVMVLDVEEIQEPINQVIMYGTLERPVEEYYEEETYEEEYYEEDTSDYYEESYTETVEETYEEPEAAVEETSTATYAGSGQDVVNYALQFVGYPYVWGGTSLTEGCDCSGFIWRVFNNCGYSINRWPDDDFPHVSASELRPGDITRYSGHYAIYIGNGMEISAVNEAQGIRTHPMYYSTGAFWYGIRVIG